MLELPEAYNMAKQLDEILKGKTIFRTTADKSHHGFAWYFGEPSEYDALLEGKTITGATAYGGRPEIQAEDMILSFGDGVNIRYLKEGEKRPEKHQLLVEFTDGDAIVCTVQMYGGLWVFPEGSNQDFYYNIAKEKPSPLTDAFDEGYFMSLLTEDTVRLSAKAFLATEQRIPGLGNGVLQDILWKANIHPKRKMNTLSEEEISTMYRMIKETLKEMTDLGGRDTEKDLFAKQGGYVTVMSKKNQEGFCPACGGWIKRMAYMGGNVYVCETCQNINDK